MATSRWQQPEALKGRQEADSLELAMRSILRMFADGNLVYRSRVQRVDSINVIRPSERLRRIRAAAAQARTAAAV
jgi:hypothetical protein